MSQKPRQRRNRKSATRKTRQVDYCNLVNPFPPVCVYSQDQIESIHNTALRMLEEIGIKILLPRARDLLKKAGCKIDSDSMICRFDRGLVEHCMATAPEQFSVHGANPASHKQIGGKHVSWSAVGGAPNVHDLDQGKRPAGLADARNFIRLSQHYDVIHFQTATPEAQDIPVHLRHLVMTREMLFLSTKIPFISSRGSAQFRDVLAMLRLARGLSEEQLRNTPIAWTVINTNSPRILDKLMLQGLIDFAEYGQPVIITPFTLAGAMAPVSIPGALVLQHSEFLAALCVNQLTRPGAPVMYGGFTSNVDMKSGAPALGTPETFRASLANGQLARRLRIPSRSSMASSSNCVDAQSIYESQMSLWGTILSGTNLTIHAAGWIESGLSASLEKFIVDVEILQQIAELMQPVHFCEDDLAFDAIAEVEPGGHFFGAKHTMERYETAFYMPFLSDLRNFGQWSEDGAKTATMRANRIWKKVLHEFVPPQMAPGIREALDDFVARRTREGGAPIQE